MKRWKKIALVVFIPVVGIVYPISTTIAYRTECYKLDGDRSLTIMVETLYEIQNGTKIPKVKEQNKKDYENKYKKLHSFTWWATAIFRTGR